MAQPTRRLGVVFILLALVMIATLAGCSSGTNGTTNKATATSGPHATATTRPGGNGTPTSGGTPSPTAKPITACGGTQSDITVPANAVQTGHTTTTGATTNCDYRIPQDLQTLDTFFKTQMVADGWTLLHDDPEGPLGFTQVYFKAQRFVTITLSQHQSDTHTTDVTISVESAQ